MKSNQCSVHIGAESGKRRAVSCLVCEEGERIDKIGSVVGVFSHPPLTAKLEIICETGCRRRSMHGEKVNSLRFTLKRLRQQGKDTIARSYKESCRRTSL